MLNFHLVGINNQNFVMQDAQTGTWWQQVSGEARIHFLEEYWFDWKTYHPHTDIAGRIF